MAENKDRLYTQRRQSLEAEKKLEQEKNQLLKERNNLNIKDEATYQRAERIRVRLAKIDEDISSSRNTILNTTLKIDKLEEARLKKEQTLEGIEGRLTKHRKENRNLSKDILKTVTKSSGKLLNTLGINETTIKQRKEISNQLLAQLSNEKVRNELTAEQIQQKEQQIVANNAFSSIEKDLIEDLASENVSLMEKEDVLNALKEKGVDLSKMTATQQEKVMEFAQKTADKTKSMDENFQRAYKKTVELTSTFDDLIDKVDTFGAVLNSPTLRMKALQGLIIGAAVSLAKDLFDAAKEVRQELGLGVGEAAALGAKIVAAEKVTKVLGGRAGEVQNFAAGIAKEFGNIEEISTGVAMQFAKISATTGITGDAAAKLAKSIQIIQGGSLETSLNMIEIFEATARTAGVMPKLVLEDIANSTETFAKFAKDGGKNIAAAAAQAAKLGLNLDTVAGIAESLLDFESSIERQMEAQVILGRGLNLDKARQLSLSGDLEGLQKEIVKQVGNQAQFEAMLPIQRKALADAIGISTADLAKFVAGEQTSAQLAKEQAEAQQASILNQETLMKGMLAMQGINAAMLAIDMARSLYDTRAIQRLGIKIAGRAKIFGLSLGSMIATLGASILGIAAIGGLLSLAYGAVSKGESMKDGFIDSKGNTVKTPKGSINLDKDDDMIVGTKLFSGDVNQSQPNVNINLSSMESKMDAQVKESKEMNQNTKKLLEQNQFLMNKLIKTTGNIALES